MKKIVTLTILTLNLNFFPSTLFAQNALPQQFDDYEQVVNTDSLEQIVRTYSGNPERYLHGLISLELSRIYYSDKLGQDFETIKTLATQTKSELGLTMYKFLRNSIMSDTNYNKSVAQGFLEATDFFESRHDTLGMIMCYRYLMWFNTYTDLALNGEKTITNYYYNKAMALEGTQSLHAQLILHRMKLDPPSDVTITLDSQLNYLNKALSIVNQNPRYEYWRIPLYRSECYIYAHHKRYKDFLKSALKVYECIHVYSDSYKLLSINYLANAYFSNADFKNAKKYYFMAIDMSKKMKNRENRSIGDIYYNLAEIAFKEKDYNTAWKYRNTSDSLYAVAEEIVKSKELMDIQILHDTNKKEMENHKLQVEKEAAAQRNLFLTIALILSLSTAIMFFYFYRKTNSQNAELQRLNKLTTRQNHVLAFSRTRMQYFMQSLSHDVLGYINNIINFLSIAAEQNKELDVDKTLQRIIRNAKHLKNMSNNLIRYGRLEQEVLLEKIDLNSVLEETLDVLPIEQIDFDIQKLPTAFANHEFVKQVFSNLISNAIKYQKNTTPLKIQISAKEANENGFIEIQVRDNGVGIDATQLANIFKNFERADNNTEGYGLGLFICQQIINSMGGSIWAESQKGIGSSFYFTVPEYKI